MKSTRVIVVVLLAVATALFAAHSVDCSSQFKSRKNNELNEEKSIHILIDSEFADDKHRVVAERTATPPATTTVSAPTTTSRIPQTTTKPATTSSAPTTTVGSRPFTTTNPITTSRQTNAATTQKVDEQTTTTPSGGGLSKETPPPVSKKNELTLILGLTIGAGGLLLLIIILGLLILREYQVRNRTSFSYTVSMPPSYPTSRKIVEQPPPPQSQTREVIEEERPSRYRVPTTTSSLPPYSSQNNRAFQPDYDDHEVVARASNTQNTSNSYQNRQLDTSFTSSKTPSYEYSNSEDDDDDDSMYQDGGKRF